MAKKDDEFDDEADVPNNSQKSIRTTREKVRKSRPPEWMQEQAPFIDVIDPTELMRKRQALSPDYQGPRGQEKFGPPSDVWSPGEGRMATPEKQNPGKTPHPDDIMSQEIEKAQDADPNFGSDADYAELHKEILLRELLRKIMPSHLYEDSGDPVRMHENNKPMLSKKRFKKYDASEDQYDTLNPPGFGHMLDPGS